MVYFIEIEETASERERWEMGECVQISLLGKHGEDRPKLSGSMAICKFPDGSHQSNGFVAALDQSLHMNYVMQM